MPLSIQLFPRGARPTTAEDYAVSMLRTRLEGLAPHIKRVGAHLDEIVNTRGELDVVCRVKLTLASAFEMPPTTIEGHGRDVREAVVLVGNGVEEEVRRAIGRAGTPRPYRAVRNAVDSTGYTPRENTSSGQTPRQGGKSTRTRAGAAAAPKRRHEPRPSSH